MKKEYNFDRILMESQDFNALLSENRTDVYFVAAMTVVALCNYKDDPAKCYEMLGMLKNPADSVSEYEKQFIKDRLKGKEYKPFSYFSGSSPDNGYTPGSPIRITVSSNPYSFNDEHWAILWLHSSGADSERQIKLREKKSTREWFLVEQLILSDIREPVKDADGNTVDPWG